MCSKQQLDKNLKIAFASLSKSTNEKEKEKKKERQFQSILHYMQMQLEEKDRSIILKDYFSLRTDPFIFTSMALELLNQS